MMTMLSLSLIIILFSPLVLALLLGASYFFMSDPLTIEKLVSRLVRWSFSLMLLFASLALISWLGISKPTGSFELASIKLYKQYSMDIRLFYDSFSMIFLWTQIFITNLISFYSHRYLHRDPYYRRFFIIISLFSFGMTLIILSGTMDLIFAGWEIVGLSSFLLIGYFWHRPKAIAAATRAYYVYRICDLGLLAALLNTHFFWHHVNLFSDIAQNSNHSVWSHVPLGWRWLLSLSILLPVLGKSAQAPFCFWLPKAMEGPTHSSAIFYGSLSIHAGVYLLIRTMPIWYFTPGFNYLLATVGLISAISATLCAQVQSNIKGQIGYASIAQVGIMLIELSFGFLDLAFFHMIGNAFLRCFQLLVSGSILTTHLHMAGTVKTYQELVNFSWFKWFPLKLRPSLYAFGINDAYFEYFLYVKIVKPFLLAAHFANKTVRYLLNGIKLSRFRLNNKAEASPTLFSVPAAAIFLLLILINFTSNLFPATRILALFLSLIFALASLGEKKHPENCLGLAIFSSLLAFLSLSHGSDGSLYAIGLLISSLIATDAWHVINKRSTIRELNHHSGAFGQFPAAANLLLIGILGITAFPLSLSYLGEEIMLSLAVETGWYALFIMLAIFLINGISLIRMYAITMMGRRDNYTPDLNLDFSRRQTFIRLLLLVLGSIGGFCLAQI